MPVTVKVEGLERIQKKLGKLNGLPDVKTAMKDAGYAGANIMSNAAPIRSGATQRGVKITRAGFNVTIRDTTKRGAVSYPMILDRAEKWHHKGWWTDQIPAVVDVVERELDRVDKAIERGWNA